MGMNPETNKLEQLHQLEALTDQLARKEQRQLAEELGQLFRPNGQLVPKHWSIFKVGETYTINNYTFRCAYIGETSILFAPVGPIVIGEQDPDHA